MLTCEQVERALPSNLKGAATQAFTDQINNLVSDPLVAEQIRENFISYTRVLQEGRFKTEDYLHAVAYVAFKHMGYSNQDAYFRTFPQRHAALLAKGTSAKDISAYVSAYHKGKLVNLIMEQSLVPMWIVNQDAYQKAINTQLDIMDNSHSDMARAAAANSVLTHLTKPKEAAVNLNVNMGETSGMLEMREMLLSLAKKQQEAIGAGISPREIAGQRLIDVTPIEKSDA
jgi:hypothetical protein